MKRSRIALLGLFLLIVWPVSATVHADVARTAPAQAANPSTLEAEHRAILIVQFGEGRSQQLCIAFSEDTLSGLNLLTRSELKLSMWGSAVCRIEEQGCAYPAEPCFCQCKGAPCAYWSYWHWEAGRWVYSQVGAASHQVHDGDIEGWAWSDGQPPSVTPAMQDCQPGAALTLPTAGGSAEAGQPRPAVTTTGSPERVPLGQYAIFVALVLALALVLVLARQRGRG